MRKHTSASLAVRDDRAVCVFEAALRDSPAACEELKQQGEQWRGALLTPAAPLAASSGQPTTQLPGSSGAF